MQRVTGVGGVFFKSGDPEKWYQIELWEPPAGT